MTANDQKRQRIFGRFSSNFSIVKREHLLLKEKQFPPGFENAVICPLCMRLFNSQTLDQNHINPLTLEDVPPKSFGGKAKILTCKKCNNTSGHKLDANLHLNFEQRPFFRMELNSEYKFRNMILKNSKEAIRVSGKVIHFKDRGLYFKLNLNNNDWRYKKFVSIMNSGGDHEGLLDFTSPSALSVETALLRIAYLTCFEKFGHAFVLNPAYDAIRHQIANPDEEILPIRGMGNPEGNTYPSGIYIIREPENIRGLIVVFPLTSNKETILFPVILPSPFLEAKKFYADLKEYASEVARFRGLDKFTDLDFVSDQFCFEILNMFRICE